MILPKNKTVCPKIEEARSIFRQSPGGALPQKCKSYTTFGADGDSASKVSPTRKKQREGLMKSANLAAWISRDLLFRDSHSGNPHYEDGGLL